jgi:hypothetical protein
MDHALALYLLAYACSLDLATSSKVAGGWYGRLEELAWQNEVGQDCAARRAC